MRTAISASRFSTSWMRSVETSSITSSGWSRRNCASIGGSTSTAITSLAEMRTIPRTPAPWLAAARSNAAAALRSASA